MIGVTLGAFDLFNEQHVRYLEACRVGCTRLIVGLYSDVYAGKQRRSPINSYSARKSVLDACTFVDSVRPFIGASSIEEFVKNNNGNVFFTPDKDLKLSVPVVVIPRQVGPSSSQIVSQIANTAINSMRILSHGFFGPVYSMVYDGKAAVTKPIHIGGSEMNTTSNVYDLSYDPLPRNWKKAPFEKKFTNISGINMNRELIGHQLTQTQPWSTFLGIRTVFQRTPFISELTEPVARMQEERRHPTKVIWLMQRFGGVTFLQWMNDHKEDTDFKEVLSAKVKDIRTICNDLKQLGLLHGDLHPQNLLVNPDTGSIAVIDMGWCMHHSFDLTDRERTYLDKALSTDFDWVHFKDSMDLIGIKFE